MVDEAKQYGLLVYPRHKVTINPDPNGHMHDSRGGTFTKFYRKKERSWPDSHGKPTIHSSVLERTRNQKNEHSPPYRPWIMNTAHEVEN